MIQLEKAERDYKAAEAAWRACRKELSELKKRLSQLEAEKDSAFIDYRAALVGEQAKGTK